MTILDRLVAVTTVVSAVGAGVMAGVLFAFSVSVMPALRTQPARAALPVMQAANAAILTPLFLVLFAGTTVSCVVLVGTAPFADDAGGATALRIAGSVLFVLGCIVVTAVVNVPMNNDLVGLDPDAASSATVWARYLRLWTAWNDARTGAAAIACVVLTIAAGR